MIINNMKSRYISNAVKQKVINREYKFDERSSHIAKELVNSHIRVHTGRIYIYVPLLSRSHLRYRIGEYAYTRNISNFRVKEKRKSRQKKGK